MVNNPKLTQFQLLPTILKRLLDVADRNVLYCGYLAENISAFLEYYLLPLAKQVTYYFKDTNDFLKKLRDLPKLPGDILLCTIDVVGLYSNIHHDDGFTSLKEAPDNRKLLPIKTFCLVASMISFDLEILGGQT